MGIFELLNVFSFVFQVVALLYIAMAILYLRKDAASRHEWEVRSHTLEAIKLSSTSKAIIDSILRESDGKREMEQPQKLFSDEQLLHMLNELERVCTGIKQGVYDERIVHNLQGRTFVSVFHTLRKFILVKRSEYASESFTEFESVVRKWEKELGSSDWNRGQSYE